MAIKSENRWEKMSAISTVVLSVAKWEDMSVQETARLKARTLARKTDDMTARCWATTTGLALAEVLEARSESD